MPTYHYTCSNDECEYDFRIFRSMKDPVLKMCPECDQDTLEMVFHAPQVFVKHEPKTVGALAERNTDNLGRYEREDMWQRNKEKKKMAREAARQDLAAKLPSGASIPKIDGVETEPIDKRLANLNKEQKINYIEKGVI